MTSGPGPTVTRRRLRMELKRLRMEKGLSVETVTNDAEWSVSKLVRIENGQVGISRSDLDALLRMYDITDPAHVQQLQELARISRQRMWWGKYQKHLPVPLQEFIGGEFDAASMWYVQPMLVPGLLQTRAYMKAINDAAAGPDVTEETKAARAEVRLRRQKELFEKTDDREVIMIVDEAVLRRIVGGPDTAREQLDHIADTAERTPMSLVVLPFGIGAHLGMLGPFTIFGYQAEEDDDVVYLENAAGGLLVREDPHFVAQYRDAARDMIKKGLRDKAAISFVRQIRKDVG